MTIPDNVINDLIAQVDEMDTELGTNPSGVYSNVRIRLDILESRVNNPFNPSPGSDFAILNLSELSAMPIAPDDDGQIIYLLSLKDAFVYHASSTATIDGITIVAANGSGRWERINLGSVEWRIRDTWYIDPSLGNDESSGLTSGTAIKTFAELVRRWGPKPYIPQATTISFLGNAPSSDPITINNIWAPNQINIDGYLTTLASGTLTNYTAQSNGTNLAQIEDTNLGGGFTSYVGKRIRFTSGVANGNTSWIQRDDGSNKASILTPNNFFGTADPGIGDSYVIEDLSEVYVNDISSQGTDSTTIVFGNFNILNSGFSASCTNLFVRCDLRTSAIKRSRLTIIQGSTMPVSLVDMSNCALSNSAFFGTLTTLGSFIQITGDCAAVNVNKVMSMRKGTIFYVLDPASLCIQDGYFIGIVVDENSLLETTGLIWGSNVGTAFLVKNGGGVKTGPAIIATIPTPSEYLQVTSTNNVVLDGVVKTYSQLPYGNKLTGASVDAWAQFGALSTTISPTINASKDNYALDGDDAGWLRSEIINISASAAYDITGFRAILSDVNRKTLINVGSFNITLKHLNGSSSVGNQIAVSTGSDLVLAPLNTVDISYDTVNLVWRTI